MFLTKVKILFEIIILFSTRCSTIDATRVDVNGVSWLIGSSPSLVFGASSNHISGLLLDLLLSEAIKLSIQRPRPKYNINDQRFEAPVFGRFSFPFGHSLRAAMLASLCVAFYPSTGSLPLDYQC
ncbi:unnamed protein product [Cylicocyclus nassatus]|uniref:Phosphatidic acid phosphatase type 2/haloperoxidase domain-containing protein n=1 Tax=Cylicocyclus nassatus TaxID=53992 RepID=A0AA36GXF4_CYLNA|nr:unnamed protein product [Cylicocyclus nassatus]